MSQSLLKPYTETFRQASLSSVTHLSPLPRLRRCPAPAKPHAATSAPVLLGHCKGSTWQLPLPCLPPYSCLAGWRQLHPPALGKDVVTHATRDVCPALQVQPVPRRGVHRAVHESGVGARSGLGSLSRKLSACTWCVKTGD